MKKDPRFCINSTMLSETDAKGEILFVNESFCEISQYDWRELVGKSHSIIRHKDMPEKLFMHMWKEIEQGKVFRGILKNKAKDESHYWVRTTIMPVYGNLGKITKYLGGTYHIRDERLAEELYCEQSKILQF